MLARRNNKKSGQDERANFGEFFATNMGAVERSAEFVRLVFFSDRQTIAIALPPSAFAAAAWLIASCGDGVLH